MIIIENDWLKVPKEGYDTQIKILIDIAITGEYKNILLFPFTGWVDSLEKSLIASLKGWKIPPPPTLFGPFRNWEYPKTFRSKRVINATLSNTGIIIKKKLIIKIIHVKNEPTQLIYIYIYICIYN